MEDAKSATTSKPHESETVKPSAPPASEYHQGTSLAFIFIALVLSIFLACSPFADKPITTPLITAPGIDLVAVVATGAMQGPALFSADQMPGMLMAYMAYMAYMADIGADIGAVSLTPAIGATGTAFLFDLFRSWEKIDMETLKYAGDAT
jgi:MFS transporter, DHA2 family, glioxin efflux transporter